LIGAVVVRFNGDANRLGAAVQSIVESVEVKVAHVVLVDNASTDDPTAVDRLAASLQQVSVIHRVTNGGFATAVNAGVSALHATCEYVLLLNDDAYLESHALAELVGALSKSDPSVISAAPKIYLEGENGLLDSVGMAVNRRGEAKNIGLGQLDLGQFDQPADAFGPCFGVALIRRSAFNRDAVGALLEEYFLYYEDVEWNWRAQRKEFRSVTVPSAVAFHAMSASSRASSEGIADAEVAYAFKHRCIERNLLATGATHLPASDAIRLWTYRWPRLVKGRFTGRFPHASLAAAFDAARRLPAALKRRRQGTSVHTAADPLRFWTPEPILFDPVTYVPQRSWLALETCARLAGHGELASACRLEDKTQALNAAAKLAHPVWAQRAKQFIDALP
jgi:GT2 family glycosyltransferase